jgi:hypothetical protein
MMSDLKKGFVLFFGCIFLLFGCDQSFDPLKESDDFRFSISGYLDVSEPEQIIRVINLQQQNVREGSGFEGSVYLRDIGNDTKIEMVPEFREYSTLRSAYNFTTDYPLELSSRYEILAEREDGATSSVQISMPSDFRDPVFLEGSFLDPDALRILDIDIDRLAEVSLRYQVLFPVSGTREFRKVVLTNQAFRVGSSLSIFVNGQILANALRDINDFDEVEITNCEFYVAKGGPEWLDFDILSDNEITLPNGITNVENGTGYMVGVRSKTTTYPSNLCSDQRD